MAIKVYGFPLCHPTRAFLQAARLMNVPVELMSTDFTKGENKTPEYLKMNPNGTIPFMDDGGFQLSESRAQLIYLAEKYGDGTLYPKDDLKKRAEINNLMFFEQTVIWKALYQWGVPTVYGSAKLTEENQKEAEAKLSRLSDMLEGRDFYAGDKLTIADFPLLEGLLIMDLIYYDPKPKFPRIAAYLERVKKAIPCFDEIHQMFYDFIKTRKAAGK